ncbi:hypothetical protein ROSEINA2194_02819 [Roseburia inulinivorans DSM 16841]|uniref:Uncharacterized protein n=1 Tax=Roseburia inulinivorans DSM 16841 TaxID=622312 RepID=C0FVP5_9FIRM|nr:hypothetical protein ROSEINA2194_02819 [Roseburia inulinivorans DSM 16841]
MKKYINANKITNQRIIPPIPAADDAPDDAKIDNIFLPPKNLLLSNIVF